MAAERKGYETTGRSSVQAEALVPGDVGMIDSSAVTHPLARPPFQSLPAPVGRAQLLSPCLQMSRLSNRLGMAWLPIGASRRVSLRDQRATRPRRPDTAGLAVGGR